MFNYTFSILLIFAAFHGSNTTILGADTFNKTEVSVEKPFQKCWELPFENSIRSIFVDENKIILTDGLNIIRSLDSSNGLNLWSSEIGGEIISNLILVDKNVYLIASQGRSDDSVTKRSQLFAINIESGITNAKIELPFSKHYFLTKLKNGLISASAEGSVYLTDLSLSSNIWKKDLSGEVIQATVTTDSLIGTIKQDKSINILDSTNGRIILTKTFEFQPEAIELTNTGELFVGDSRGVFYKINALTGNAEWTFKTGGSIKSIKIIDDALLLNSTDNFIYKILIKNGKVVWRKRISGRVKAEPLVSDKKMYHVAFGEEAALVSLTSSGKTINKIDPGNSNVTISKPLLSGKSGIILQYVNGLASFDQVSCKK